MSHIEARGLVLGTIPIRIIDALYQYRTTTLGRSSANEMRVRLQNNEYGFLTALIILTIFPDALPIMVRVERYVLSGEAEQVMAFMESFSSSFNMTGVAGAIIAQVAISSLSLANLADSHWTAEAFFILSLVTGALSVFFSCVFHPAVNGLHSADDIKDWLSKPVPASSRASLEKKLKEAERATYLQGALGAHACIRPDHCEACVYLQELDAQFAENRWKVASCYSAVMLTVPTWLLSLSLNTFIIGLGIYLGEMYTASLIPSFGSGSLGILIIFIVTVTAGVSIFYIPEAFKGQEALPIQRFEDLSHAIRSRNTREQEGQATASNEPPQDPGSESFPLSTYVRPNRNVSWNDTKGRTWEDMGRPKPEQFLAGSSNPHPAPSTSPEDEDGPSTLAFAPSIPTRTSLFPPSSSDILNSNSTPKNSSFKSALLELIRAQEESVKASCRLLEAYENSLQ